MRTFEADGSGTQRLSDTLLPGKRGRNDLDENYAMKSKGLA
jgi:hypothetical protein